VFPFGESVPDQQTENAATAKEKAARKAAFSFAVAAGVRK
jgi:hypothetical protein